MTNDKWLAYASANTDKSIAGQMQYYRRAIASKLITNTTTPREFFNTCGTIGAWLEFQAKPKVQAKPVSNKDLSYASVLAALDKAGFKVVKK